MKNRARLFKTLLRYLCYYRDIELDPVEYLVMDDRKLVFVIISKVACTSIKAAIGQAYGITSEEESILAIHVHPRWCVERRKLTGERKHYYKFAFVRNPLTRLVSCYRDKIIYDHATADYSYYYYDRGFYDIPPNTSFSDFIARIHNIPDFLAERHFKSQYYTVHKKGRINVDFVGKFENLNEDWSILASRFDFNPNLEHFHSSKHKDPCVNDVAAYYDDTTLRRVLRRYKSDFDAFGYQKTT